MNASYLRLRARESLSGTYWPAVLAAIIAGFFGAAISTGVNINISFNFSSSDLEVVNHLYEDLPAYTSLALGAILGVASLLGIGQFVVSGVVQIGYARFLLKQDDRYPNSVNDLFSQFYRFGQGFLQMFLRALFIGLWSLLFVIPGIMKSYSYAMTPFIMADHPQMSAKEAIDLSKQAMDGHRWELFCLELSFLGWIVLSILTLGIGFVFLTPYMQAAYAAFYRTNISPKIAPQPVPWG